uniref:uncharacterized protein LOC122582536 isoform X2 n=1 Tax=Erigeron canadensis TaxID=72917 RepID=UPI001CB8BB9A|nr:uncharacterized protein LOC122582536 isoform X2 [Erigeron canadensis]
MDIADDLTFRIIFSGDGAGRLRDRVKEKLKEFMGDYTDDTLVEYVIVLLKNGRRKEEARNELNVFLGDDSDSFVSWLWDHLRSNLDLYAQSKESHPAEVVKQKPQSELEGIKSADKLSNKSRRNKDWKGVIRDPDEPPPLRSAVIANVHKKRSVSPQPPIYRKRGRSVERNQVDERAQSDVRSGAKREEVTKSSLGASRRLLQFAVRDAVAMNRSPGLTSEPSFKRLRSVVSTPIEDSPLEGRRPKIRSVARVPNAMTVAIKAVADAARDVSKVRTSGNVFDRLGRSSDISDPTDAFTNDDEKHGGFTQATVDNVVTYPEQYVEDIPMLEHDAGLASDFAYNIDHTIKTDNSHIGKSGGHFGSLHYNAKRVVDGKPHKLHRDQDTPVMMANFSRKMVDISSDIENQKLVQESELGAGNYRNPVNVSNGNGVPAIHAQKEIQKTLPSTGVNSAGRPTEDADLRTIFVSNVHFGATKDSLSRHFNKFGDVLKVVIVTETATGQPKGSAYVEFMRKDAAANALSLDGTSFMSRILKVVMKSPAQQEAASVTMWPRVSRASTFTVSRFGRVPFPRGIVSPYRSRYPIKTGARSLQWKREAQNPSSETIQSPTTIPSPTTRSLIYVRTENKIDGSSNAA